MNMSSIDLPPATNLARHMHDTLYGKNELLNIEDIEKLGIHEHLANPNGTEKLSVHGEIGGMSAYQTLSRDRNGAIYLSTVFMDEEIRSHEIHSFREKPGSDPESDMDVLLNSIYMKKLIRLALDSAGMSARNYQI
jgi:hypothetical protein